MPSYFAVQRYLREFLSDRRVIDTPRLLWRPLLYGFILSLRSFRTARNYRKIWTPADRRWQFFPALKLKITALLARFQDRLRVELAMSYGNPGVAMQSSRLPSRAFRTVVLPLYPQYCSTTTGAVFDHPRALQRWR